jgi:sec-independent protein translocase protein TatC
MLRDIDETPFTLTEHLTELRSRLLKALLAVIATSVACLVVSPQILDYSTEPLRAVLRAGSRVETLVVHHDPEAAAELRRLIDAKERANFRGFESSLGTAVDTVRAVASSRRPIDLMLVSSESIGADGAYVSDLLEGIEPTPFVAYLVDDPDAPAVRQLQLDGATVILEPVRSPVMARVLRRAAGAAGKANNADKLVVLSPLEVFFAYLKIALVAGLFLACPIWLYQAWAFVAPGLYAKEKRVVLPVILSASGLFIAGGLFAYYVMFPVMFDFLVNQMLPQTLAASFTVDNYIGLLLRLTVAFGVVFELPLAIAMLASIGIVTPESLSRMRKYAIIIAFVLGAFLTPADPVSQFLMAGPLIVFYEIGIILARIVGRPRSAVVDDAPAESGEVSQVGDGSDD